MARRPFLALMALTAVFTAGAAPASARSTTPDEGLWTTDGTVHALARDGRTVYVGGEFSWVGPHRGALARTDAASGERRAAPRFTGGAVAAIEDDGAGGAFVGGSFTHVDGAERRHLVHLRPDGSLDPAWSPAPDGRVLALLRAGRTLYVGGAFERLGGQTRMNLGAVDVATGVPTAFDPEVKRSQRASVGALAMAGSTLYVAGSFLVAGGEVRNGLAALDTTQDTLNATEWNPSRDGAVGALHVHGSTLYLGGAFTKLGGAARSRIAAVDTATGHVTPFDPGADGDVKAFASAGSTSTWAATSPASAARTAPAPPPSTCPGTHSRPGRRRSRAAPPAVWPACSRPGTPSTWPGPSPPWTAPRAATWRPSMRRPAPRCPGAPT